jgi:hypothetical protein
MAINSAIFSNLGEVAGMKVLFRENAQIEWAEKQIQEKAEQLAKDYNTLILRGFDPRIARDEYIKHMAEYCNHFLPIYEGAAPYLVLEA